MLKSPDPVKAFIVDTDVSAVGFDAMLSKARDAPELLNSEPLTPRAPRTRDLPARERLC